MSLRRGDVRGPPVAPLSPRKNPRVLPAEPLLSRKSPSKNPTLGADREFPKRSHPLTDSDQHTCRTEFFVVQQVGVVLLVLSS